jgi:phosphate transport system substrate-binding protein
MRPYLRWCRRPAAIVAAGIFVAITVAPAPASANGSHEQIQGSGSSWSANAVNQWISDVQQNGLQVVYTPSGSAAGRTDFANGVTDFAVSDIGYQGVDRQTGQDDVSKRPYAYLPIVAGGTAFPYQVRVRGQLDENIRLSQMTLAKIFTNQITNWDDPEITSDNNGVQLPSLPIIPVVHSEGAGTTFQLTQWLNTLFPQLWKSFSGFSFPVEYWPTGKGSQIAENGSDGVMNFISSSAGNGSIGFDEYSYAIFDHNWPVAKVENTAGYFNAPDQYNVAVSLTQAQINYDRSSPDYLLENLTNVYTYGDPRDYPLSSYSYEIEPTASSDPTMDTAKRQTLADFTYYSICQGQAEMGPIGYSPLPVNLVEASFQQVGLLHQADPNVILNGENVESCHNPTFVPGNPNANYLAQIAPLPPSCDKAGQGPCAAGVGINLGNPSNGHATQGSGGASSSAGSSATGASSTAGASAAAAAAARSRAAAQAASTASTAAGSSSVENATTSGSSSDSSQGPLAAAVATVLDAAHPTGVGGDIFEALAAVVLLVLLIVPPFVRRARKRTPGDPT